MTPLKRWRTAAQLTTEEVANCAGVTAGMWSRWENGKRKIPGERVLDIESITGVSRHELRPDIFGTPTKQSASA